MDSRKIGLVLQNRAFSTWVTHYCTHCTASRHVTSCHVTSRHVTSRHVTSRHVTSRRTETSHPWGRLKMSDSSLYSLYLITSRHVMSRHFPSRHVTWRDMMWRDVMWCDVTWRDLFMSNVECSCVKSRMISNQMLSGSGSRVQSWVQNSQLVLFCESQLVLFCDMATSRWLIYVSLKNITFVTLHWLIENLHVANSKRRLTKFASRVKNSIMSQK